MTKEDRNLLRAMFLLLFWLIWDVASEVRGVRISVEKWNELYNHAMTLSKKEE